MMRTFLMTAAAVAIVAASPTLPALAQSAPQTQVMAPPGTPEPAPAAPAKPKAPAKAKVAATKPAVAKPAVAKPAQQAVPVDPAAAAGAAGIEAAAAAAAKAKPADAVVAKPIPPAKKAKLKKGAAPAAPIEATAPTQLGPLTGEAAWTKMVGNSINGMYDGSALIDAYLPDNVVKTRSRGETKIGRWGFVEGRACFQYEPEPQASCYEVALDGDQVTYTDETGEVLHFTLSQGIPPGM